MGYIGTSPSDEALKIGDDVILSSHINDGVIVNADINASAAIAMSKTALAGGTGLTLSTNTLNVDAAQTQITSVGTIGTGVWNGTAIASAYLDADTAHLSTTQTFSGAKTFGDDVTIANNKQILGAADGVAYSFTGDTDTGIQSGGTNTIQITTAGSKAMDFDGNQLATFTGVVSGKADATAGAPAYTFTGDTNTGIYRGGADQLQLATGGAERIQVNNNSSIFYSDVTMYLADDQLTLHLNSPGDAAELKLTSDQGTWSIFSNNTADELMISDGTTRFQLNSTTATFATKVFINQDATNAYAFEIDHEGDAYNGLHVDASALTTGSAGHFYSNANRTADYPLVELQDDNASSSGYGLKIRCDGDGDFIRGMAQGNNTKWKVTNTGAMEISGANYDQLKITGSGTESGIKFIDSGGTTDGFVYASGETIGFLASNGSWTLQTSSASATFSGDINMTGSQKKMKLHNSSNTVSNILRVSNRDTYPSSGNWADEYAIEIHGATTGTNAEVLMFLHHHENSSDRPILRAMNSDDTTQIEFGSNQQYKFRGKLAVGDDIHTPVAPFMVKAPGIDGGGLGRFESTSSSSNPEGILVYYPSNSSTSGWAFYQANSAEGKSMIHNNGDFDSRTDSYGGWSDERIKTDITDASSQWDDIKNIRMRNFKFKSAVAEHGNDAIKLLGTVAQEVELVSPALVAEVPPSKYEIENCGFGEQNEDGEWVVKKDENGKDMAVKTMKSSVLYMKAVKCLQEAMEKIETLETKVAALENA